MSFPASLFLLAIGLLALYGASLQETYLFADETWLFADNIVGRSLFEAVISYTSGFGRPLTAPIHHAMSQAIHLGDTGLPALRVLQYVGSLVTAVVFVELIVRLGVSRFPATLLALFIWSQPAFAIAHLYVHVAAGWPFALSSLLAFWLVVDPRSPLSGRVVVVAAYTIFLLGFFGSQVAAFFCAGVIALATLLDRSAVNWRKHAAVFAALCAAFLTYVLFYFAAKSGLGWFTYRGGARVAVSLETLRVFEFWNYPLRLDAGNRQVLLTCGVVALAWLAITLAACVRERTSLAVKLRRWGLAYACVALTFIVVLADGSSGRQHLFFASVPALTMVGWYALARLTAGVRSVWLTALALPFLLVVMAGGSLSYQRDLVRPAASMFAFIERSLLPERVNDSLPVTVIVPRPALWRQTCPGQPCGGFYDRQFQLHWHLTRGSYYATVLRLAERPWRRSVQFVEVGAETDPRPSTVDWPAYLREQACLGRLKTRRYPCPE